MKHNIIWSIFFLSELSLAAHFAIVEWQYLSKVHTSYIIAYRKQVSISPKESTKCTKVQVSYDIITMA